jgi:RNA polymerase sigma-70 factor (ECF subfamily)
MTDFEALFDTLVEPHRALLRLHCYRMLGSSHDSDDMVQETLIRAFRSLHTLEDKALARAWLHRIATNVCLDELKKRPRRARGQELGPPGDPERAPAPATPDDHWIEPAPSTWLSGAPSDPAAQYTMKESVALAFVAALQILTPAQRAVLLLRDVVGLSAEETASALESSVSAANSTLHRARVALEERVGPRAQWSPEHHQPIDQALLHRYMAAWQSGDLETIIALLHEDATLSMPPIPTWFSGRDAIQRFLGLRIRQSIEAKLFRTVAAGACGQPAVAFYRVREDGQAHIMSIDMMEQRDGRIVLIEHMRCPSAHAAFLADGLPRCVPA